jgi:antibiotic biosynthesis monooxygenase (ABM) superfamily enzyme
MVVGVEDKVTEGATVGFTLMVIFPVEVAVDDVTQVALEVMSTEMTSLFASVVLVKVLVLLADPTLIPLIRHW